LVIINTLAYFTKEGFAALISCAETILANMILGSKGFAMTNTLGYFSGASVTQKIGLLTLVPLAHSLLTKYQTRI